MGAAFDLTIGNLATRQFIVTQYTPLRLSEEVSAEFERLKVLGLSHQPLQYSGTTNHKVSFPLDFHGAPGLGQTAAEQRRFLLSNCYPSRSSRNVKATGPSGIVFDWPNLFSLVCAQISVKFDHDLFNRDGSPLKFTAQVTFEELRDVRLYAEDVARLGTVRR
jgi:hypothetical protein